MLKRFTALLLTLLFVFAFTACKKESDETDTTASGSDTSSAETTTAAETTEAATETEAPRDKYNYIDFYDSTAGDHTPFSLLAEGSSIGMHFNVAEGFLEDFSITCPSWSDNVGSLTMRIYKWNTDYATSVAGTPVKEETFVDYEDNAVLTMVFNEDGAKGLEAGEYLVTLGDGVDAGGSGVGLWYYGPAEDPAIINYFANGEVVTDKGWEASATIVIPAQ